MNFKCSSVVTVYTAPCGKVRIYSQVWVSYLSKSIPDQISRSVLLQHHTISPNDLYIIGVLKAKMCSIICSPPLLLDVDKRQGWWDRTVWDGQETSKPVAGSRWSSVPWHTMYWLLCHTHQGLLTTDKSSPHDRTLGNYYTSQQSWPGWMLGATDGNVVANTYKAQGWSQREQPAPGHRVFESTRCPPTVLLIAPEQCWGLLQEANLGCASLGSAKQPSVRAPGCSLDLLDYWRAPAPWAGWAWKVLPSRSRPRLHSNSGKQGKMDATAVMFQERTAGNTWIWVILGWSREAEDPELHPGSPGY
jgi:hypothetical protein